MSLHEQEYSFGKDMALFLSDLARSCSSSQSMPLPCSLNSQKKPEDTWAQISVIVESRQGLILTSGWYSCKETNRGGRDWSGIQHLLSASLASLEALSEHAEVIAIPKLFCSHCHCIGHLLLSFPASVIY